MPVVYHAKDLSMGMCIECHRSPEEALRPLEEVFNLKYDASDYIMKNPATKDQIMAYLADNDLDLNLTKSDDAQRAMGLMLKTNWKVQPKESCFTCHR